MLASVLAIILSALSGQEARDACATDLPQAVKSAAARLFPGYRLPKQSDNLDEDIKFNLEHGGDGCLGVASGDFNGDGKKDFAFLVAGKSKVWLAVAMSRGESWLLEKVWFAGDTGDRIRLYVDTAAPGKFDDLGLSESLEPGQVETFTSDNEVIVTGTTESTGIAFMRTPKGWVHVWISD
jgi:hypothetical protein